MDFTPIATDAFSSGQVGSKLWLCETLEQVLEQNTVRIGLSPEPTIWIYGGWQGVLGFMLLSRPRFSKSRVRSFDLDPESTTAANVVCENWVWREWQFRAFTVDCDQLDPMTEEFGPRPAIIINTSVEHFANRDWFERIPKGTIVVLQATDFDHDGAVSPFRSETDLARSYKFSETFFSGSLEFKYDDWKFHRFMQIGVR